MLLLFVITEYEGRITQKIVYEIFVISKSQDFFERFLGFLRVYWKRRARTRGHGQTDTDTRTRKTDSYGKDGHLWKRRTVMEKTGTYGKDGHLWKRRALLEKTGTYGKDGHLWKRRALMEKTDMCVYILN